MTTTVTNNPIEIDEVQELVKKGQKNGELTYKEVMNKLKEKKLTNEEIDRIHDIFQEKEIDIIEDTDEAE